MHFSIVVNNIIIYYYVGQQLVLSMQNFLSSETQSKMIKEVVTQATFYIEAYLGNVFWSVVLRVMESMSFDVVDEAQLFSIMVIQSIMVPSTGVFNLLIYL